MTVDRFQKELQHLRATNGWTIEIECCGVFIFTVRDKDTNKLLATTGATELEVLIEILQKPFDKAPWANKE